MNPKTRLTFLMFFCFAFSLFYLWQETAQAARFGRGRSFGSRPSYQRSAPAPAKNPSNNQSTTNQNMQQKPLNGTPSSPMGRWGGMLGGFIMGGLIGSLFFGGGHGFGGIGLMDILLIAGGIYLLMRFMRSRQMATQSASPTGSFFDRLAQGPTQQWSPGAQDSDPIPPAPPTLPPGFDADAFLKGADAMFTRMQGSWDQRDLDDIRQFTSAEVFAEIEQQAQEDPQPERTEILLINSRIIEMRDIDGQTVVSVFFDVMLREDGDRTAKQVRELWHFSRETALPESFWTLEGIQQIE